MIQIALLAVSVGLIALGIKGFTPSGLALSQSKTLEGPAAKAVGILCILGGIGLIPLVLFVLSRASTR